MIYRPVCGLRLGRFVPTQVFELGFTSMPNDRDSGGSFLWSEERGHQISIPMHLLKQGAILENESTGLTGGLTPVNAGAILVARVRDDLASHSQPVSHEPSKILPLNVPFIDFMTARRRHLTVISFWRHTGTHNGVWSWPQRASERP